MGRSPLRSAVHGSWGGESCFEQVSPGAFSLVSSHSFVSSSAAASVITASPRLHDSPGPICTPCRRTRNYSHTQPSVHGARQSSSARHATRFDGRNGHKIDGGRARHQRTLTAPAGTNSGRTQHRRVRKAQACTHGGHARHRWVCKAQAGTHSTGGRAKHQRMFTTPGDAYGTGGRGPARRGRPRWTRTTSETAPAAGPANQT